MRQALSMRVPHPRRPWHETLSRLSESPKSPLDSSFTGPGDSLIWGWAPSGLHPAPADLPGQPERGASRGRGAGLGGVFQAAPMGQPIANDHQSLAANRESSSLLRCQVFGPVSLK